MLQNIDEVFGRKLGAIDGEIGHVKDFYFDDQSWVVRYIVADTGSWLTGRLVLLPPRVFGRDAFGKFDPVTDALAVNLTRKQIEESPTIESHRPVSRQYEAEYYSYFGWPAYWPDYGLGVVAGIPAIKQPPISDRSLHHGHNQRDDRHLRSVRAVTGYHLQATDGRIGTVRSFMVNGASWAIRELVVETGHWYAGKSIQVLTENVIRINEEDSTVFVNLTLNDISETTRDGVAHVGIATD